MASLTAKVIKGRTYYYARECRRVGGRPKIVRTVYLGSLDRILAAVQGAQQPPAPQSVDIASFGDVAALYDLAQSIGLVELIDRIVPKRCQGLGIGQYLLLAAITVRMRPPWDGSCNCIWAKPSSSPTTTPGATSRSCWPTARSTISSTPSEI